MGGDILFFYVDPISFGIQDCLQDSHELVSGLEPNLHGYNIDLAYENWS